MAISKIQRDILSSFTGKTIFHLEPAALDSAAYPLDLEPTLNDELLFFGLRDSNGLPMVRFPSFGKIYVPTRMAAFALAHYNRFLIHKNSDSRTEFLKAADWFMRAEDALWHYANDYGELKAPWVSGMAQGEGVSVLVRAFSLTNEGRYIEQAKQALAPLMKYKSEGGVRSRISGQHEFIEEYPFAKPSHTLNGFMYCLIGLHDLAQLSPEAVEAVGFSDLFTTLETQIDRWDIGYWTTYDLHQAKSGRRNVSTMLYHRLHISLLTYLAAKLDSQVLKQVVGRWDAYCHSPVSRIRALGAKILYRLDNPHVSR